jgi:hypothetical protein
MAKPFYNVTNGVIINTSFLEEIIYDDSGETVTLKFNSGAESSYEINTLTQHFLNFLYSLKN